MPPDKAGIRTATWWSTSGQAGGTPGLIDTVSAMPPGSNVTSG
jgi:hypothetical protein